MDSHDDIWAPIQDVQPSVIKATCFTTSISVLSFNLSSSYKFGNITFVIVDLDGILIQRSSSLRSLVKWGFSTKGNGSSDRTIKSKTARMAEFILVHYTPNGYFVNWIFFQFEVIKSPWTFCLVAPILTESFPAMSIDFLFLSLINFFCEGFLQFFPLIWL